MLESKHFKDDFRYLTPPASLGELKVLDVLNADSAEEHRAAVWNWSRSVWATWTPQRDTIQNVFFRTLPLIGSGV